MKMSGLLEELASRGIPKLPEDRGELLRVLAANEYGAMPLSGHASYEVVKEERTAAGTAKLRRFTAKFPTEKGMFELPAYVAIPKKSNGLTVLFISFAREIFCKYCPLEELVETGTTVASVCYLDITSDDGDMQNLLAGQFYRICPDAWGKIGMWAYGASRVMDCLADMPDVDTTNTAVLGHSRLGKTALWCAANDERFRFALSNDSGCSGAAITRGKRGERVADITKAFPFWFCDKYKEYAGREAEMPFDQHFLIAAAAPRCVCIGSATEDIWADPESELLAAMACGLEVPEDKLPEAGERVFGERIGYQLRGGTHFLSRHDWHAYIDFCLGRLS